MSRKACTGFALAAVVAVSAGGPALAAGGQAAVSAAAANGATASAVTDCNALVGLQIPASAIGLPTTGATVSQASPNVTYAGTVYCNPTVLIHPVDPKAPDITAGIGLPDAWGGRSIMFGGGGYDGSVPAVDGQVPYGDGVRPLDRGMVTYASNSGHVNSPTVVTTLDGSFGTNDEALRNFAGDALKKTHDATMFVLKRYYPSKPKPDQNYFAGGSSGGREALAVLQRWPQDVNGVIAIYPAYNALALDLFFGYEARLLSKPDAFPNTVQQELIYQSSVQACDAMDGVKDGLISNESACHYDPAALRCPSGVNANSCLSDAMIAAVKKLSSPTHLNYTLASGETGYPGFPFLSGADMTPALLGMGQTAPAEPEPQTAGYGPQFWGMFVKYIVTRDPSYDNLALDPFNPGRFQQRISDLSKLQDVNNANLAPFADRGGKLLIVHGTADELVSHRSTVDYYHRVQAKLGAARTHEFSRLYLVPGANHANIGGAYTAAWDSVTALEQWVRGGKAPVAPVVADTGTVPSRTRPLCEYTSYPRYVSGDVNAASSFRCALLKASARTVVAKPTSSTPPSGTPAPSAGGSLPTTGPNGWLNVAGLGLLAGSGLFLLLARRRPEHQRAVS